jgi:hypothetical protein
MTAKEKLLLEAPGWTERQAEIALRAVEDAEDEWGNLSKLHEVATSATMQRLNDAERQAGHPPW